MHAQWGEECEKDYVALIIACHKMILDAENHLSKKEVWGQHFFLHIHSYISSCSYKDNCM